MQRAEDQSGSISSKGRQAASLPSTRDVLCAIASSQAAFPACTNGRSEEIVTVFCTWAGKNGQGSQSQLAVQQMLHGHQGLALLCSALLYPKAMCSFTRHALDYALKYNTQGSTPHARGTP